MIINYQQLARVRETVAEHIAGRRVHVFLDESHRIKGANNISTDAVLDLSYLPVTKLVMSGTPMPQSPADLLPQFRFLFPEISTPTAERRRLKTACWLTSPKSQPRRASGSLWR